jgi:hypothetical protein
VLAVRSVTFRTYPAPLHEHRRVDRDATQVALDPAENAKSGRLRPDGAYVDSGVILEVDVERGVGDINLEMA